MVSPIYEQGSRDYQSMSAWEDEKDMKRVERICAAKKKLPRDIAWHRVQKRSAMLEAKSNAMSMPPYARSLLCDPQVLRRYNLASAPGIMISDPDIEKILARHAYSVAPWGRKQKKYEEENNVSWVGIRTETKGSGWDMVSWHYADYTAIAPAMHGDYYSLYYRDPTHRVHRVYQAVTAFRRRRAEKNA